MFLNGKLQPNLLFYLPSASGRSENTDPPFCTEDSLSLRAFGG